MTMFVLAIKYIHDYDVLLKKKAIIVTLSRIVKTAVITKGNRAYEIFVNAIRFGYDLVDVIKSLLLLVCWLLFFKYRSTVFGAACLHAHLQNK